MVRSIGVREQLAVFSKNLIETVLPIERSQQTEIF